MADSSRPDTGPPATGLLTNLIDTHCHLDAPEYDNDREAVIQRARAAGVQAIVVPAVTPEGFAGLATMARQCTGVTLAYALGIHPLAVPGVADEALERLQEALAAHIGDPRLVAVGEIGLDFFVNDPDPARQERFFEAQLALAARYELPVIVHSRKGNDRIARALRRCPVPGGISHAFNGSEQQARTIRDLGLVLGFGGVMTFARARRIRQLASQCPVDGLVLETDGPDLSPAWLAPARNEPGEVASIAHVLAGLRGQTVQEIVSATRSNAIRVLPRLASLVDGIDRGN